MGRLITRWLLLALAAGLAPPAGAQGRVYVHVVGGSHTVDLPWDTLTNDGEWWRILGLERDAERLRRSAGRLSRAPVGTARELRLGAVVATLEVRPDGQLSEAELLAWLAEDAAASAGE